MYTAVSTTVVGMCTAVSATVVGTQGSGTAASTLKFWTTLNMTHSLRSGVSSEKTNFERRLCFYIYVGG